ncbi:MAG: response regulator [Planctomycetes bacterium]|nr:response regulator [Planctomycetota bacterium]
MIKKILIVDDQPVNIEIFQELLEDKYELLAVNSGEQCLESIKQFAPDVIILDIMMPGIDGYQTCQRIKSDPLYGQIQVMLVSAKASMESRLRGYEAGADDYLSRPFNHEEFLAKVEVQIRLREALTKLESMQSQLSEHNTQLESVVHQRTEEIVETRDLVVFSLAKLAESRDPETSLHLDNIRQYSQILAEHYFRGGISDEVDEVFVRNLYRSSPLHDIGKVGIPDAILLKPDRLSTSEFEILKRHTIIGYEALNSVVRHGNSGGFLEMGAEVARSHHERFDGSGYPDGLAEYEIPLSARIVALADVFDALTSIRVYKTAIEPEVAKAMIENEQGRHFDPDVVDAFRSGWQEFLHVRSLIDNSRPELVEAGVSGDIRR